MAAAKYTSLVQQIYIAYFGRPADSGALTNYSAQLDALGAPTTLLELITSTNPGVRALINSFGTSAESIALYGSDTLGFVGAIYTNVLNRTADLPGLLWWAGEIDAGRLTKATAALNIAQGAIALAGNDAATLAAKVVIATNFTAAIDTAQEVQAYAGDAAAAIARTMLKSVTATTVAADFQATVTSTLGTLVARLNSLPGLTFTLTTGIDSGSKFAGADGNDTFNAISASSGTSTLPTLTGLDVIDGGGGFNTMNVFETAAMTIPESVSVRNIQLLNIQTASTLTGRVTGWGGLNEVVAIQYGGNGTGAFTAGGLTDVRLEDGASGATTMSIQGGRDVSVTARNVTGGGVVNVGTITAPTGSVKVATIMEAGLVGVQTANAINVKGGTSVTVNADLTPVAGVGNTVTGSAITVTGSTATTTVTVSQTQAATARDAVIGVAYKLPVAAIVGTPGVDAVAAVVNNGVDAVSASAGVVNGAVTVNDAVLVGQGTINSVALTNYGTGSSISSNALSALSLNGSAGTLTLKRAASPATTSLNLTVNSLDKEATGSSAIVDTNNEIKTLNITTAGSASTLTSFASSALTTLNIGGTADLTMTAVPATLTKIAVSGAAGFSDGAAGRIAALGATLTSFTSTSSGKVTATLDASKQGFQGGTGQDIITISTDASKAITGGSHTGDVLVLNGAASVFNATSAKLTSTNVSGFEVLGLTALSSGTYDMSTMPAGMVHIDVMDSLADVTTLDKVASGAALSIGASQSKAVALHYADAIGTTDPLTLRLGTSANAAGITVAELSVADVKGAGVGTLTVTSLAQPQLQTNTITTLANNGLSRLNIAGNAALEIGELKQESAAAAALTIHNTSTGLATSKIGTITDANLNTLTFSGSGNSQVGLLTGMTGKTLTLSNTGTGSAWVGALGVGVAPVPEQNTVQLIDYLEPGASVTVGGRTVKNISGTLTLSASQAATALSGGTVATGLEVSGEFVGFTGSKTTNDTITFTSTGIGNVPNIAYSGAVRPAAAPIAANSTVQGNGTVPESVSWIMKPLTVGQYVIIDGLRLTAERSLTALEVAAAFADLGNGGASSPGNYTKTGDFADSANWAGQVFTSVQGVLTLTSHSPTAANEVDVLITPTVSAASTTMVPGVVLETVAAVNPGSAQSLQTINLNGNVALGANLFAPETALGATTGVTVAGATDHAHVNLNLNGAAATFTDNITLGNGNNQITDNSTAGTVNISVGSGGNLIRVNGGAAATFSANITLAEHTNTATVYNRLLVSVNSIQTSGYSTRVSGAATGDVIVFSDNNNLTFVAQSDSNAAMIANETSLFVAIEDALAMVGMNAGHTATSFQWRGDTYIVQNVGANSRYDATIDSVVKLVGLHIVGDFGVANGAVVVVS